VLERSEAEAFLAAHPEERDVVRPFLVGDDLSNTPDQAAQRFVIDFGLQCLEEARRHPQALAILSERVRPVRERLKTTGADAEHRKFWWRFANPRRELREKAQSLPRLLATARLSKRPVFAFFPSNWTPSEQVVIFPIASWTAFAVLQSRVHAVWVDLQATHMGEGIRYSATDCFAPFPFPELDPLAILPSLERVGARLYVARAELMARRGHGLTKAYDLLADCRCQDPDVAALRAHHDELEHAVLEAYGWQDLTAPCWGGGPDNAVAVRAFEDAVAGRLFVLNRERATPQRTPTPAGSGVRPRKSRVGPGPKKAAATAPSPRKRKQHA
jgi:hypothetical protein